ncbi:MAG: hypothetical protein FHP92_04720 [Denitromonas halophila]|nr:MAG: hypothetical protein FHP92_04720 [Denitromonas halophila]
MFNKKTLVVVLSLAVLSGCAGSITTNPISINSAKPVPADRLLAFQGASEGLVKITITRDSGFLGGGCFIGFALAGQFAARFDPEEKAEFYIEPGKVQMSAVPDPQGQGLCGAGGWDPVIERYDIAPNETNIFRISMGMYRRPRVTRAPY